MMNDLNAVKNRSCNTNMFEYGLSTLHAWIRCFECILHIAYRMPIKKWQIRDCDKNIAQQTKLDIKEKLRKLIFLGVGRDILIMVTLQEIFFKSYISILF